MQQKSQQKCFGGTIAYYSHRSEQCQCEMHFSIYLPPQAQTHKVPLLYYLSGLTCTEENFTTKAGAQRLAAQHGIAIVAADTSPRGAHIPDEAGWDFGSGAGFYVDATETPWSTHYNMYSYITQELPELLAKHFPIDRTKQGIFGHSMGGHGALICALRNPNTFKSVSAFAPIVAPTQCPWGEKAFSKYLGNAHDTWRDYDATELVQQNQIPTKILIDQGTADIFLETQLQPQIFETTCQQVRQDLHLRYQDGYDHSYYFIATFIDDHILHHVKILNT